MTPHAYPVDDIALAVLAGGQGRRMGGEDKGLVEIAGRPMVAHVLDRLRPQAGVLLVNANRNRERYAEITGCRVVADREDGFAGPARRHGERDGGGEHPLSAHRALRRAPRPPSASGPGSTRRWSTSGRT